MVPKREVGSSRHRYSTATLAWSDHVSAALLPRERTVLTRDHSSSFDKSIEVGCWLMVKRANQFVSRTAQFEGTFGVGENDASNWNVVRKSPVITEVFENGAGILEQSIWRERPKILDLKLKFELSSITLNLDFKCVPDCTIHQLFEVRQRCDDLIIDRTKYISLFHESVRWAVRQDPLGYQ